MGRLFHTASETWSASPHRSSKGPGTCVRGSNRTDPTDTAGTPWCEDVNGLKLSEEIGCFVRFFRPTELEKSERANIEACVLACAREICDDSTVKRVGAYSYGIGRYDAPLELVIEGTELTHGFGSIRICTQLQESGFNIQERSASSVTAMYPSVVCDPIVVVISIEEGWRVHKRTRSRRLAKLLSLSPSHKAAGQAVFVLSSILSTCPLGLTTDVLTVMALAHLAQAGTMKEASSTDNSSQDGSADDESLVGSDSTAAASFFLSFLSYLSSDEFCSVVNEKQGWLFDARTGVTRTDQPGLLFVRCPTDPNLNLATGCDAHVTFRLKMTAVTCFQQVTKTEEALRRSPVVRATDTRTPLSSVYAYHKFWPRKFKQVAANRPSPPVTPVNTSRSLATSAHSSGVFTFDPYTCN